MDLHLAILGGQNAVRHHPSAIADIRLQECIWSTALIEVVVDQPGTAGWVLAAVPLPDHFAVHNSWFQAARRAGRRNTWEKEYLLRGDCGGEQGVR